MFQINIIDIHLDRGKVNLKEEVLYNRTTKVANCFIIYSNDKQVNSLQFDRELRDCKPTSNNWD